MTKSTHSNGSKMGPPDRGDAMTACGMLSRDEYEQLYTEQGALRKKIADLNQKINHGRGRKTELIQQKEALSARWQEINSVLGAAERTRTSIRNARLARLESITGSILAAKLLIERLKEEAGDNWSKEEKELCSDLRRLSGPQSPLLRIRQDEIDRLREENAHEVAAMRTAAQKIITQLQGQIRDLQERRGAAASVLTELYEKRYEEIDTFRTARGITHRIHLTAEDCRRIEIALSGITED